MGFALVATGGTAAFLQANGVPAEVVLKVHEGRPHAADLIKSGRVDLVVDTPLGRESFFDEAAIRKSATQHGILCLTTLTATAATVRAIQALREQTVTVVSLQEIHAGA
jgi:carbamoyl-phosphate synthase large subunit